MQTFSVKKLTDMRLVGDGKSLKKALVRLRGFIAERIPQLFGFEDHGWLRADSLSILSAQVSRFEENSHKLVHSPHRFNDQRLATLVHGSHVSKRLLTEIVK